MSKKILIALLAAWGCWGTASLGATEQAKPAEGKVTEAVKPDAEQAKPVECKPCKPAVKQKKLVKTKAKPVSLPTQMREALDNQQKIMLTQQRELDSLRDISQLLQTPRAPESKRPPRISAPYSYP